MWRTQKASWCELESQNALVADADELAENAVSEVPAEVGDPSNIVRILLERIRVRSHDHSIACRLVSGRKRSTDSSLALDSASSASGVEPATIPHPANASTR
jgi:hypothetical protein